MTTFLYVQKKMNDVCPCITLLCYGAGWFLQCGC